MDYDDSEATFLSIKEELGPTWTDGAPDLPTAVAGLKAAYAKAVLTNEGLVRTIADLNGREANHVSETAPLRSLHAPPTFDALRESCAKALEEFWVSCLDADCGHDACDDVRESARRIRAVPLPMVDDSAESRLITENGLLREALNLAANGDKSNPVVAARLAELLAEVRR